MASALKNEIGLVLIGVHDLAAANCIYRFRALEQQSRLGSLT